ncbi:hypothetical protein CLCR_04455 [Cladophialophora carrionii]|uniref:Uncharacterized protein n=1 Tax=Cladophialophora carrionii TaxID=86049 RepID=A0A1C1CIT7_9EURO|nr:hypothetical protein CLCR_04455 [Cladophialophora carrionii]
MRRPRAQRENKPGTEIVDKGTSYELEWKPKSELSRRSEIACAPLPPLRRFRLELPFRRPPPIVGFLGSPIGTGAAGANGLHHASTFSRNGHLQPYF